MSDVGLRNSRTMRGVATACLVLAIAITSDRVVYAQGGQVRVDSVLPNLVSNVITISGVNFGTQPPSVTLNDAPLVVVSASSTQIVAVLPGSVVAAPGTYQLVVRKGNSNSQNSANVATIDVAIPDTYAAATGAGPQGPAGPPGNSGPQGAAGAIGPQGATGAAGPMGPQGATGVMGPQGATGPAGPQGATGPAGPQGASGPAGPQGDPGSQGATGLMGPQGASGPAGPQGAPGVMGPQGATGVAGAQGSPGPRIGHMYRWSLFSTFDNPTGHWLFEDSATMFGGVAPSAWSDASALAGSITSNKDMQRSLLTQKGYPGRNAVVVANTRIQYSSIDGTLVVVLFRVKNTTAAPITWQPHYWYSCYRSWGEAASAALNGVNVLTDTCESSGKMSIVTMSIPANRTSTAIFVSGSGVPAFYGSVNSYWVRATVSGFVDDSLALPSGLEFVDDLDTATGGYEQ